MSREDCGILTPVQLFIGMVPSLGSLGPFPATVYLSQFHPHRWRWVAQFINSHVEILPRRLIALPELVIESISYILCVC